MKGQCFFILDDEFEGDVMNDVDELLSRIGGSQDRFGPNWSPLDRIIHQFHMKDLWTKIRAAYNEQVITLVKMYGDSPRSNRSCVQ